MHGVGFIILGAQLLRPFHSREIEKEGNSIYLRMERLCYFAI
jgi:hypothetical protein